MKLNILFLILILFSSIVYGEEKSVKAVTVKRQTVTLYEPVFGTVVSERNAKLATEVSGRITEVKALGSVVKKDDVIARVDTTFLELSIKKIMEQREKALAEQEYLDSRWLAYKKLIEKNSISDEDYQSMRTKHTINKHHILELNYDAELIGERVRRGVIRAPFDGVIAEQFTQVGEAVEQFDPLVRLLDNQNLVLHIEAPTDMYNLIEVGSNIRATNRNNDSLFEVVAKYPMENFDSRKFTFRVKLSDNFVIGEAMTAHLPKKLANDAYLVPFDALIKVGQGYTISYLAEGNKVRVVEVEKLFHVQNDVAVTSDDLPEAFDVISEGSRLVATDEKVRVLR